MNWPEAFIAIAFLALIGFIVVLIYLEGKEGNDEL